MHITKLPIDQYIDEILKLVNKNKFIFIKSSPGTGKTTRLPPALARNLNTKILVLEPRKLAAKLQAMRIANETKTSIGEFVGYVFKGERQVTATTQIIFVTEGTFLKFLESDPLLKEFNIIILDEFHERHVETDLAFYHLFELMKKRNDLKLVFMSATLNTEELKTKINDFETFNLNLPPHDLFMEYAPNTPSFSKQNLQQKVQWGIERCLAFEKIQLKGILVFLPGKKEIEQCFYHLINHHEINKKFHLCMLHGSLSKEEQQEVFKELARPKIILATNIAESSITIEDINIVIDSGLERINRENFYTGFSELMLQKTSQASSIQRAGRANRTTNGLCIRLFSEVDFSTRETFKMPEILNSHLAESIFDIVRIQGKLYKENFLTRPSEFQFEKAELLLNTLNIKEKNLIKDRSFNLRIDLILAKIVSLSKTQADFLYQFLKKHIQYEDHQKLQKAFNSKISLRETNTLDEILLWGFLDLLGRIQNNRFILNSGEIYEIDKQLKENHIETKSEKIYLALEINPFKIVTELYEIDISELLKFKHIITQAEEREIINNKVKITRALKFGNIVIKKEFFYNELDQDDHNSNSKNVINSIIEEFIQSEDYTRLQFFKKFFSDESEASFDINFFKDILTLEFAETIIDENYKNYILEQFQYEYIKHYSEKKLLDFEHIFPKQIEVSDKRKVKLQYEIHDGKYLIFAESYMQDFFGLKDSPKVGEGKIKITFRLLGPHKRALQVTNDLKSFWATTYKEMLKELSRDYPRHHWPLDPEKAQPVLLKRMISN